MCGFFVKGSVKIIRIVPLWLSSTILQSLLLIPTQAIAYHGGSIRPESAGGIGENRRWSGCLKIGQMKDDELTVFVDLRGQIR